MWDVNLEERSLCKTVMAEGQVGGLGRTPVLGKNTNCSQKQGEYPGVNLMLKGMCEGEKALARLGKYGLIQPGYPELPRCGTSRRKTPM